ncbi:hypothetical protein SCP_0607440 [Sparassis crispa]|uniref:Uncharacterized protein n=1 Tax=Sparassis crispa TaxID=139825 RepID=A0A401GSP6_9APHY|nr:hypothetical protein SCP_0607440 [Sparassis crispa]GBE84764.1 hypothetical protein SCP_0607440 [Sparassis crispa]
MPSRSHCNGGTLGVLQDVDRELKQQVLEETRFKDDDLGLVTVCDPYFGARKTVK